MGFILFTSLQLVNNSFLQLLFLDIANQLYGKSIERVRDRLKLHFVRTYWQFNRLQNMSGFRGYKIVSDSLVLVFMTPAKVRLNKPLHIGATILEHSKRVMYDKFYQFIIPSFDNV